MAIKKKKGIKIRILKSAEKPGRIFRITDPQEPESPLEGPAGIMRLDSFSARFTDNPNLRFFDVSDEAYRVYLFKDGSKVSVLGPIALAIKAFPWEKDWVGSCYSHRIVCENGSVVYVPPGWISMCWFPKPGRKAVRF